MNSLLDLRGKTILVLGGGQGIGEAISLLLAQLGAKIAVVDLDAERAEAVASATRQLGVDALGLQADVMVDDSLIAAIARSEQELAPPDGLVTVVGMAGWAPITEMSMETWDMDHRRNLRYVFLAAREVCRSLRKRDASGSIVFTASIDGLRNAAFHASYGAAKAGIVSLVKTMAVELSEHGIRVNAVAPGATVTPRIPLLDPAAEREALGDLPMRRRGGVDDIAKAVAFFMSDMSPYVTGQTLAVDGGFCAGGPLKHRLPQVGEGGTMDAQASPPRK